ncbi:hypothetical protein ASPZODRAFT_73608 [Penicilliopsis zonata CBS 506.65]|uniref:GED domain-containing protein n=1 Tax=Penicilliopsis zonata CBS 506.65 TaxID=1073090 RepID=A0A1L9S9P0_9EURO|nr:hypothetical protein ASPZODRAFT_73608 [Penicilliopsis zonata CBS 506.65]OJJ43880.1 hypothetical protein ASPZODRAFT_73608 [Penicilliopsis zonata CBS 506.65]
MGEAGDDALQQLQSQQSELLDVIDELRTIGLGRILELPQLIVCGNQSSGKSSVLEAISRVRFPAKSNVCTRFATEVILRRSPSPRVKVSIEPGPSRKDEQERQRLRNFASETFEDGDDLPSLIEKAKEWMGISDTTNAGFSDDVLKVEISGPDKPELSLVDLPGLYYSTSKDQGSAGIHIVRNLVERYMKNTRSIILAVITAKSDYHLQEVLNIAERFDPQRERTLGIITQPDILEPNSEEEDTYLQFIRNEKIRLQLGWHALRNRSFESKDASDDARDEKEKEFFNSGRWETVSREFVGIDSLRRRLSSVLLNHIKHNLPSLITEINEKITIRQAKLAKLGNPRSTLHEQRAYLLKISGSFERLLSHSLDGIYRDEFFGGLDSSLDVADPRRLRAVIRELNEEFSEAMYQRGCRRQIVNSGTETGYSASNDSRADSNRYLQDWTPVKIDRGDLEEEMAEQARLNRGIELPGNANQFLIGNLFRDQSQPWEDIARTHLLTAWESVRDFIDLLLQHLADDHSYPLLMSHLLDPALEEIKENLLDKLREVNSYNKRGHPLPFGRKFIAAIRQVRKEKEPFLKTRNNDTADSISQPSTDLDDLDESLGDQFAAFAIIDMMQAYYNITITTFIDNVAILAIENCLLLPLEAIFTSLTINNMEREQIELLASEPAYIKQDRNTLQNELEKLQAGLRACSRHKTLVRRPNTSRKPAKASDKGQENGKKDDPGQKEGSTVQKSASQTSDTGHKSLFSSMSP